LRRGKWLLRFAVFGLLAIALFLGVYGATGHYKSVYPLPLAAPEPNGLDDYLAASVLFQMKTGLSAMTVKMPKLLDESHMVQVNQPAIARLRVGLGKPCGIPFDPTGDTAYMNAQQCLYLAKLLRAESDFYSAGGNAGRAASSALDIIQIGEDIGRNGPLEYAFAGNTLQFFGQAALLKVVDILTPSENQSVVSRYVQLIQNGISPSIVIDNEGRWRIARLASEDDLGPFGIDVDSHSPLYVDRIRNVFQRLRWHMARDDAIRSMERYFKTAAGEAGKVAPKRKLPPLPRGDAGKIAPVPGYFNHAINALNIVALRNRLLLIEIALHGYRARNGRLPDSLDALDLAPKLLADPSSGLPIVYKPSGDDYLLYGAGPDGVDDGGIPLDEPFQRTKGDIGIRAFMLPRGASVNPEFYRKVPHMKPPVLPSGSSALKP
jgi:hypothetical protein